VPAEALAETDDDPEPRVALAALLLAHQAAADAEPEAEHEGNLLVRTATAALQRTTTVDRGGINKQRPPHGAAPTAAAAADGAETEEAELKTLRLSELRRRAARSVNPGSRANVYFAGPSRLR
jgi:hypothetical protein